MIWRATGWGSEPRRGQGRSFSLSLPEEWGPEAFPRAKTLQKAFWCLISVYSRLLVNGGHGEDGQISSHHCFSVSKVSGRRSENVGQKTAKWWRRCMEATEPKSHLMCILIESFWVVLWGQRIISNNELRGKVFAFILFCCWNNSWFVSSFKSW